MQFLGDVFSQVKYLTGSAEKRACAVVQNIQIKMAEQGKSRADGREISVSLNPERPVPMKFFATWEVERTSPNCIPR